MELLGEKAAEEYRQELIDDNKDKIAPNTIFTDVTKAKDKMVFTRNGKTVSATRIAK